MQKKNRLVKISPLVKYTPILSNQAEIQVILPTHELVILIKFHKEWQEIVDFLAIANF